MECVELILRHLSAVTDGDPREILRAGEVNKSWHAAADRPATYAHMLRARYDVSDLSSPFTFPNHGDLPPGDPRRVEDAWLEMGFSTSSGRAASASSARVAPATSATVSGSGTRRTATWTPHSSAA